MKKNLERLTLDCFISQILELYSDNPALGLVGKQVITYGDLGKSILKIQAKLKELGVTKGSKVVILGENSPNWCVAYLACTTMGLVTVPILTEFPESDINHIINHSRAAGIFIDDRLFSSMDLQALDQLSFMASLDSLKLTREVKSRSRKTSFSEVSIKEDDLAEILYTSGTTGHSKGVMLTHKNIISNALSGPPAVGGISPEFVILNLLPLAHAYGCTTSFLGGISCGASVYFLDRKPSPKVLMDALQQIRPMIVTGVPLIFEKIFHKKVLPELTRRRSLQIIARFTLGRKFLYHKIGQKILDSFGGRLFSFVIGGASLNQEVEIFLREGKIPFAIGYGLSECSPLVAGDYFKALKPGSVGRVIPGIEVRIEKADPESKVGEILVRGPNVMKGYYKNPEETKKVFSAENWLRTGDLGYLDDEGYLYIKGRIKNVYVGPSGENIYPEIVEDKLRESMYVEEALVYMDENRLTARIYLDYDYIQTILDAKAHTIQPEEIHNILERVRKETNAKLPSFSQVSRIIEQPEPFVKTPTNKIKRLLYVPDYQSK